MRLREQDQESDSSKYGGEVNIRVKMLCFKYNQTDEIVEKRERQSLERHQSSIASIVSALDTLTYAVEKRSSQIERERTR